MHRPSPHHPLLDLQVPCTTNSYKRRLRHLHHCLARVARTDAAEIEHELRLWGMMSTC